MKPNVAHLATTFRMSGEVLAGTVGRKPHVRSGRRPQPCPGLPDALSMQSLFC